MKRRNNSNRSIPTRLILSFLLALLCNAGCSHPLSISSRYEIVQNKPDGLAVSKTVVLLADNQLNHMYGDPFWLRSEFIDQLAQPAIRPVQLDLFGQDILRWAIDYYGSQGPVIHLGDACNMGCSGELESFFQIMSTAKKPWVMAPGNHDSYFFGNTHVNAGEWAEACKRSGGPMTKDCFVSRYLGFLKQSFVEFRSQYPGEFPQTGEWRSNSDDPANFLRSVAWKIDPEKPWSSYVVQELDLRLPGSSPPTFAILLDSTQYAFAPALFPSTNAGINGGLQDDQLSVVGRWLENDPAGEKITILMSHHPYGDLDKGAKDAIDDFRGRYRIALYVSAHTHSGQYYSRGGSEGWLELNVGSIVDWPVEFRSLAIHEVRDNPEKLVLSTREYRIMDLWKRVPTLAPKCDEIHWEAKPEDKDYYLSYAERSSPNPAKTQEDLMDTLLHSYKRLLKYVPSATDNQKWAECCPSDSAVLHEIDRALIDYSLEQKISLLIALRDFDEERKPQDGQAYRDYRLCQAMWASKYDKLQGRRPESYDSYILFPRR